MTIAKLLPEINANQLKMLHRLLLDEVIGDNFTNWGELTTEEQVISSAKNELRAEQRTKLTTLLGENEEL